MLALSLRSAMLLQRRQGGITLVEVLVSLLIFALSVMGYSALQTRSVQESLDNQQRAIALWRANGLIDHITANNSAAALATYDSEINGFSACTSNPPADCADTGVAASICSAEELAAFDVWSTMCEIGGGAAAALIEFDVDLTCPSGCAPGADMTLTINWISKAVDSHQHMDADAAREQISLVFRP